MTFKNDDEKIEIDLNTRSIRGEFKAGKWKEHFDKVREAFR